MIKMHKSLALLFAIINLFQIHGLSQQDPLILRDLQETFLNPPPEARPRGYWVWAHGNFEYDRITEELEAFAEMGLGGVDIYDMGIADPYDIIPPGNPFLGEVMLDGITFSLKEAQRLGLSMGLSVSNGWNAGGEWTTPEEMIMRLLFWQDTIPGPAQIRHIGFPEIPLTFEKSYGTFDLFPQFDSTGFPVFYENVALVAYPLMDDNLFPDPTDIIYFDVSTINGNEVNIELPSGKWVLSRAVVSPLGQKMWMRSDRSEGWIMDHYSKEATKHHFEHVIGKLRENVGDLQETALERLYLASFEAEDYIIWSPELKETFLDQHGYDLTPFIPVFADLTVVDEETSGRFLYDYRLTVSEMFINNHYRQARDICHEHGLLLASESGGPGPPLHFVPTEDLKALGSVDVMRGEFWNRVPTMLDDYGNDITHVVKNISSAAHIYGHKIVEMEAFTSFGKHWQERPLELKKLADQAFCEGMTRVVYHTMPHSPKEAGLPGWSYQAGTHISPKMAWWELSKPFHDYLSRTSAMLQQGLFVADVAYYYGEEIPNFAIGSKFIRKSLGEGYDYDDLNKEILQQCSVTEDGRVLLPSGMSYPLLVLPDQQEMSLEVLQKIEYLLQQGASILGPKPSRVPGLADYQVKERKLKDLADQIWPGSQKHGKRKYGKGMVYTGYTEQEILKEIGIQPDFRYIPGSDDPVRLDYVHRSDQGADIYFICNIDSTEVQALLDFRLNGKQPYLFDPVHGSTFKLALFREEGIRTLLPLNLTSYGSVFIIFLDKTDTLPNVTTVHKDGKELFPGRSDTGLMIAYNDQGSMVYHAKIPGIYELKLDNGCSLLVDVQQKYFPVEFFADRQYWDVYFPHGWGFEPVQKFDSLVDWTSHEDEELSIFSGMATYQTSFRMTSARLADKHTWYLDLGAVGEVARVYLNGQEVGTSVFPPHIFSVDSLLLEGPNNLVIDVANTWLNQLVGEKDKPFAKQRTRSNVGSGTRENMSRPWEDYPALPSGLMGPVQLIRYTQVEQDFE